MPENVRTVISIHAAYNLTAAEKYTDAVIQ